MNDELTRKLIDEITALRKRVSDLERIECYAGTLALTAGKTLTVSADTTISEGGTLQLGGFTHDLNAAFTYATDVWTPSFSSSGATFGYGTQYGTYTRLGNVVFVTGFVTANGAAGGTTSNELFIAGLPFTVSNTGSYQAAATLGYVYTIDVGATTVQLNARFVPNTTTLSFRQAIDNAATATLTAAAITASGSGFIVSGMYHIQ